MATQAITDAAALDMTSRSWSRSPWFSAGLVIALLAFAFIGWRGLWEPDEGRYVAVACQMVRSGDWIHPALHEELPHYSKPPMMYWLLGSSMTIFGWHEWALRLPGAMAFAGTVLCIGGIARRVTPGRSLTAALLYATCALPVIASNIVTTDTVLTFFETLAVLGFVRAWKALDPPGGDAPDPLDAPDRAFHGRGLWLMWFAFGLAFMTKGPPGLLPLLVIVVVVLLCHGLRATLDLCRTLGLLIFLVVGFWWYVLVTIQVPGLLRYFLFDEVYARVASDEHHRNAGWYFAFMYLPILFGGMLPWSIDWLRPRSGARALRSLRSWREHPVALLLALWIAIPLIVFMLALSRLPLYVLPLMGPLALATAYLKPIDWWTSPRGRRDVIVCAAIMLGVRTALGLIPSDRDTRITQYEFPVTPRTTELVFVDQQPQYGLTFYLDLPVEYATVLGRENVQSLADELLEFGGQTLLVIGPRIEPRVNRMLDAAGWSVTNRTELTVGTGDKEQQRVMLEVVPPPGRPAEPSGKRPIGGG